MKIEELVKQKLQSDSELKRVEVFILHHSLPDNTRKCLSTFIEYVDWPYKVNLFDTSYYPKGLIAKIYNKLVKESTCNYIAFVCSDVEFTMPWLRELMGNFSWLESNGKNPGCIAPLILPEVNSALGRATGYQISKKSKVYELIPEAISISISLFKKSSILEVKGFDERFFLYGHDNDLLERLKKRGYRFFVNKNIIVNHKTASTAKSIFSKEELEEVNIYNNKIYGK